MTSAVPIRPALRTHDFRVAVAMHQLAAHLDTEARQERICIRAREERPTLSLKFPAKGDASHFALAPRR